MATPAVPPVIPQPFANNNAALRNTIPNTTSTPGQASWDQGFPADTMQPVVAGGVPPFGQDMNGVEFALSSHDYYVQAGALFPFQTAVATAIGGYGVGTLLSSTDPTIVWFNTVANNMTDPDGGSAAGWVTLFSYGYATPSIPGAGNYALTNAEATRKVVVLNGTLTGNLTVIVPNTLQDWLFVNNTSGAFTTTVRTAAGGGVAVPQGGFSNPLGVYGDGTNIYPTVAPLGVPIDQAATPLTIVERTNAGYILATYFNQSSPIENPPVGAVFVQNVAGDGFLRKASLAYLESVMDLAAMGGQVTPAQVPYSTISQYLSLIYTNASLTGAIANTRPLGDSTLGVANTAFVNPGSSLTSNGFRRNPDFSIEQWGVVSKAAATQGTTVTFNVPFPNACLNVQLTGTSAAGPSSTPWYQSIGAFNAGNFTINANDFGGGGANPTINVYWRAVGW